MLFLRGNLRRKMNSQSPSSARGMPRATDSCKPSDSPAELARVGFTIVSGLARGIDAAAHRGRSRPAVARSPCSAAGCSTSIRRSTSGWPREIAASGYLLSESPPRMIPLSGAFPQRNRIISGLTLGTIVVEAADRSGALITARHAYEQGREVFAVPGPVDSRLSHGCHALIKDGAKLVESIDDVLAELGPLAENVAPRRRHVVAQPAELLLNEIEQQVLQAIDGTPTSIDAVAASVRLPIHRVLSTISVLEMRRLVRRVSGTQVVRMSACASSGHAESFEHHADRRRLETNPRGPSALSQLDFRVEGLEFTAGVVDFHLPVDAALRGVDVGRPGGQFGLQRWSACRIGGLRRTAASASSVRSRRCSANCRASACGRSAVRRTMARARAGGNAS